MTDKPSSHIVPVITIIVWLVTMLLGFWWFEYRYWQSFMGSNVTFNGALLKSLYKKINADNNYLPEVTVVHFTDKDCPCSSYSREHIKNLQPVLEGSQQYVFTPKDSIMTGISIPAIPSVAVWDKQGTLAYFGPYSSGAVCGLGDDFVTRVLNELKKKINPQWINMLGIGCYCPWANVEKESA